MIAPALASLPQRLSRALLLTAALALPVHGLPAHAAAPDTAAVRLPALGESAAADFDIGAERRLGEQIMGEIRRDPDYIDDPALLAYLNTLWQPLVQAAHARGDIDTGSGTQFVWEAFLVRDKSVNAFALPGGYVGVHLGLIAMTHTPDQLASVLAHELTHVTQRHIARSIAVQQRQTLLSVAGMILALLAASRTNSPDLAQAAVVGGQAAALQGQLNFSRDMEREADRIGSSLMQGGGFDPAGMGSMFELLDQANRFNDSSAYPYLRSHPLTLERQSEARLRAHGLPPRAQPVADGLHELMGARARVLMDPSAQALRRLQEPPTARDGSTDAQRLAALYAAALAASRLREHGTALQRLHEAQALLAAQSAPGVPAPLLAQTLALLQAELQLAAGDASAALGLLSSLRAAGPAPMLERPLLMLQAHAALRAAAPAREPALRDAAERLQTWAVAQPQDALGWQLLGDCTQALGQRLRALRAQAEARVLLGDLTGAIDRLNSARQLQQSGAVAQDFIESSIIEARWRELQARRRALLAEHRGRSGDRAPADDLDARP